MIQEDCVTCNQPGKLLVGVTLDRHVFGKLDDNDMTVYSSGFYEMYCDESYSSAREIVPFLVERFKPESVVDVGCGLGTWLSAFREQGVGTILGIDGDYVPRDKLFIGPDLFLPHDLGTSLQVPRRFDLAISMEVAEHIPARRADTFISSLASLADVILFSAAVPHQGGAGHVNEQWPEYWIQKFADLGFVPYESVRKAFWENPRVAYYYSQNSFLFVHHSRQSKYGCLEQEKRAEPPYARIHPRRWLEANDPKQQVLRPLLRAFPYAAAKAATRRLRRFAGRVME